MLKILESLFDMISSFLVNIDSFFTAILDWAQTFISLISSAGEVFFGISEYFPAYIAIPISFIFSLVIVLRVWAIITSGG